MFSHNEKAGSAPAKTSAGVKESNKPKGLTHKLLENAEKRQDVHQ